MKEDILNTWLENIHNHSNNDYILFCRVVENDVQRIMNNLRGIHYITSILIEDLKESKRNLGGMNQIIISDSYEAIENMKYVSYKIIYIEDIDSINRLINLIKNKSFDNTDEIRYELLQKIDFESLLTNETIDIEKFVRERLYLLEKINSNFENITHEFLITCLNNYHKNKILFASFAQLLYRLANLDFKSTSKKIGGKIREVLNVKSKPINSSNLSFSRREPNKSFRVYDLKENTFVADTKIKIAQELVKLNIKELDVTKISKITELPLKKVETMYREAFLG